MIAVAAGNGCGTTITDQEAHDIAGQAATAYARRCWWASREVLVQAAWCSILTAAQSGNYRGGPVKNYLAMAAYYGVSREIYRSSAPVSGSDKKCNGLVKVSVDALAYREIADASPEDELGSLEWTARVRHEVLAVVSADRDAEVGISVILDGERPAEVAKRHGVSPTVVYRAVDRMKRKLARNSVLARLAREMG